MRDVLNRDGYSKEEEYFYKLNQELIEKKRQELAAAAKAPKQHAHWMKCPKCGDDMKEIDFAGINLDKCTQCNGIYFDNGELEILMESKEPKGFLGALKRLF